MSDAGWGPLGPCDDVISRVAAGSGLPCCLLFLPNRKDMAPASQPWGRYNGSGCRLHTHSVCTEAGKRVEWVEWSSCGRDTSSEARDWGAGWRARALAGELVLWALDGGCAHVKGAGVEVQVQVQVQCKMPNANVGHQAGCGVSWASATFGRCWCRGCTALGVVGDETAAAAAAEGRGQRTSGRHET